MSELEIIGRAAPFDDHPPVSEPAHDKNWLSLCEASQLSGMSVDDLKRAIRAGRLQAVRRGWWRVHRGDLAEFLHRL